MQEKAHLIIVGCDEIVTNKYLELVESSIEDGYLKSYSIIDTLDQEHDIKRRLKEARIQPKYLHFLPVLENGNSSSKKIDFIPVFEDIIAKEERVKVYIATELKAHEEYLTYCIENNIDSLVEKPIFAPMKNGVYDPEQIDHKMKYLTEIAERNTAAHSVMTLSRYHRIYNTETLETVRRKVIKYEAPVSSFHMKHAGGVWNLHREFISREDHPYKYGYGMIMHGGYHYLDLAAQFLSLNKHVYPEDEFSLSVSSFGAFPKDQEHRISKKISSELNDSVDEFSKEANKYSFGETDITSVFELKNETKNATITVGTLSLEQTTPSYRHWSEIPDGLYNKNGRLSTVDVEAHLSTLYSMNVLCHDIPVTGNDNEVTNIDAEAIITTKANAAMLPGEQFVKSQTYHGVFHRESNKALLESWLHGNEHRSTISSHVNVMQLVQALSLSLLNPGKPYKIDYRL